MHIDLDVPLCRANESIMAEVDDEVFLMSIEKGNYYALDKLGSRIWTLLADPITPAAIIATLAPQYAVDVETFSRDTLMFLGGLVEHDLIRTSD